MDNKLVGEILWDYVVQEKPYLFHRERPGNKPESNAVTVGDY